MVIFMSNTTVMVTRWGLLNVGSRSQIRTIELFSSSTGVYSGSLSLMFLLAHSDRFGGSTVNKQSLKCDAKLPDLHLDITR